MVLNQTLSRSTQEPSTPQSFNYDALNSETRIVVQQRTSEIKSLMRHTAQGIIDIGQKLIEVKQQLGHGNFRNWLKAEFEWGISTATKFMQVAEKFKCVNFTQLDVAASALYLLAAPSTSDLACEEALELASQGEAISYTKAKTIVGQYQEIDKSKASKVTLDVPADTATAVRNSSTQAMSHPPSQNVEVQSAAVVKCSGDEVPKKETEAAVDFQVSNHSYNMAPTGDSGDYSLKDQAEIDGQSLFWVGHLIYLTDSGQQESKLLGEIAEVKAITATDLLIRVSLHPSVP